MSQQRSRTLLYAFDRVSSLSPANRLNCDLCTSKGSQTTLSSRNAQVVFVGHRRSRSGCRHKVRAALTVAFFGCRAHCVANTWVSLDALKLAIAHRLSSQSIHYSRSSSTEHRQTKRADSSVHVTRSAPVCSLVWITELCGGPLVLGTGTKLTPLFIHHLSRRSVAAQTTCNGYSEFCSKSYSKVSYIGAHNSYGVREGSSEPELKLGSRTKMRNR